MRFKTTLVAAVMAVSAVFPLAGTASAYHCYSPEFGDCSAVQHALENFMQNFKEGTKDGFCNVRSEVTGETCS